MHNETDEVRDRPWGANPAGSKLADEIGHAVLPPLALPRLEEDQECIPKPDLLNSYSNVLLCISDSP